MTNLHEANIGFNKFCGPAVLSILTGESTDVTADILSQITGQSKVKGVYMTDLVKALERMRYDAVNYHYTGNMLFSVLKELSGQAGIYIISLPHHFVIVEVADGQIYFCDNHTKTPIRASSSARLTQAVEQVVKVIKRGERELVNTAIEVESIAKQIDIYRVNHYKDSRDNNKTYLGYFRYSDQLELRNILKALRHFENYS